MSGVIRLLCLPVIAALALLLLGCGLPSPPADSTATAVPDEEGTPQPIEAVILTRSFEDDITRLLRAMDGINIEPIPTLERPTATPTPEATATPEVTATVSATPVEEASPTTEPQPTTAPEPTTPPEPTATPEPVVANDSFATEFLALLNAERTSRGMQALANDDALGASATQYAGYMGASGFFGHYGPDGSSPESRVIASGYSGDYNGEALAAGQRTPQAALTALLNSPSHAEILLDPSSVEVGVGYAFVDGSRYGHYWAVVTGIP
jgi:uncharacterized protein YkwD